MQEVQKTDVDNGLPDSMAAFLKRIAAGFIRKQTGNLKKALVMSAAVFALNFILVSVWGEKNEGQGWIASFLVKPGNLLKGSILWATLSALVLSLYEKTKSYGLAGVCKGVLHSLGSMLKLGRNIKSRVFLVGALTAFIGSIIYNNTAFGIAVFLSVQLSGAFHDRSSLIYITRVVWSRLSNRLSKAKATPGIPKVMELLQGFSLGLALYRLLRVLLAQLFR